MVWDVDIYVGRQYIYRIYIGHVYWFRQEILPLDNS